MASDSSLDPSQSLSRPSQGSSANGCIVASPSSQSRNHHSVAWCSTERSYCSHLRSHHHHHRYTKSLHLWRYFTMVPSKLLSSPSHTSDAPGYTSSSPSLQSLAVLKYPEGWLQERRYDRGLHDHLHRRHTTSCHFPRPLHRSHH